ncbi:MAG: hypothetical protein WCV67_05345 [Victivallaceae bacterium]|jgi:hypothetical protein
MNESHAAQEAVASSNDTEIKTVTPPAPLNLLNREIPLPAASLLNSQVHLSDIFKFLYNANPFYLLSACLILYAQTVIFETGNIWMETAIPVGLIAAYTMLLTATAVFIVKAGAVWDDARSILLIILTLIMVLSVSMDGKTLDSPLTGAGWLAGGLIFSTAVAGILRNRLGLRLPFLFNAVFYAMISIFFIYPFVMAQLVSGFPDSKLPAIRGMMLFPVICGTVLLLLIPVIRRGRTALDDNGTPWKWPLFPWSIFGLLAAGACFRTYLLSISFYAGKGAGPFSNMETGFDLYMLIPIALASMILLLEFNLERNNQRQVVISMAAPVILSLMAGLPSARAGSEIYCRFLSGAVGSNGSPMLIAIVGTLLFYLYAWYRRVKYSDIIVCAVLFLALPLNMRYQFLSGYHLPCWLPGAAGLAMLSWIAFRSNSTVSWMVLSLGMLTVAGTIFRDTFFTAWHCVIPFHLALITALLLGLLRHDRLAVVLRYFSTTALSLIFVIILFSGDKFTNGLPQYVQVAYLAVIFGATLLYCLYCRNIFFFVTIGFNITALLLFAALRSYNTIEAMKLRGLNIVFWGLACFAMAFIISAFKGKLIQQAFINLKIKILGRN